MSTVILIAGPTASGKSALALELAAKLRGVIINADSMQVYRDLRIITARPSPGEEKRVPHRLYGHVDAAENYSVGRWFGEAATALKDALRQRQPAIVVGGTGPFFSTLTRRIAARPARLWGSAARVFIPRPCRAASPQCRRSRRRSAVTSGDGWRPKE